MEKMPGHPRLHRRGSTYYHRAAIPVDIADSYPKTEETFSLKVKDYREALKLVRIEPGRWTRADQMRVTADLKARGWTRYQTRVGSAGREWRYRSTGPS